MRLRRNIIVSAWRVSKNSVYFVAHSKRPFFTRVLGCLDSDFAYFVFEKVNRRYCELFGCREHGTYERPSNTETILSTLITGYSILFATCFHATDINQ